MSVSQLNKLSKKIPKSTKVIEKPYFMHLQKNSDLIE